MKNKLLATAIMILIAGCSDKNVTADCVRLKRLDTADALLIKGRNKLDITLGAHGSGDLKEALDWIDAGIDQLQLVEQELRDKCGSR